jgi:hypothetical protein
MRSRHIAQGTPASQGSCIGILLMASLSVGLAQPRLAMAEYAWTVENNLNVGAFNTGRYSSVGLDADGQPLVAL